MEISEKLARISLAYDYEITPRRFLFLLEKYKSAKNILLSKDNDLLLNKLLNGKKKDITKSIIPDDVIVYGEEIYPKLLSQINDPPLILFYRGNIKKINFDRCIGIVGTRKISKYGICVTKGLVRFLVDKGYTIVSGLAYGIDALAHQETLASGGQTIAVLGTSINDPYPQSNKWLYKKIINNSGLVVSESLDASTYGKWMFPKRNRIIAGLCNKLIVIEAPEKSGALITANFAFDFNRDVFGIPGEIFWNNSIGVHNLIRDNKAKIISKYEDIFENDQLEFDSNIINNNVYTSDESEVIKQILLGNNNIESLVVNLRYGINSLLNILGRLELNNVIEKYEDGTFMVK